MTTTKSPKTYTIQLAESPAYDSTFFKSFTVVDEDDEFLNESSDAALFYISCDFADHFTEINADEIKFSEPKLTANNTLNIALLESPVEILQRLIECAERDPTSTVWWDFTAQTTRIHKWLRELFGEPFVGPTSRGMMSSSAMAWTHTVLCALDKWIDENKDKQYFPVKLVAIRKRLGSARLLMKSDEKAMTVSLRIDPTVTAPRVTALPVSTPNPFGLIQEDGLWPLF